MKLPKLKGTFPSTMAVIGEVGPELVLHKYPNRKITEIRFYEDSNDFKNNTVHVEVTWEVTKNEPTAAP